ncbi:serine/threonine-protein kinase [Aneurinibacillus thermoaerophilus]|uniref:serine/threonine-protein kinase n=1 Tax=Aneurinibacillus thermoaerophilus TaxID=143495 RepID=UPI002E211D75|nr:serine/threonine-protein kinase [Aneurinibacillus thermoaerophilus]MED0678679.1 serine/threonine-protein kinase [Aneurinibacillus thermoaerophilus]MED0763182.1 serine/threonine-protein kinase [Aneurinibacillus thermoaerophilus]
MMWEPIVPLIEQIKIVPVDGNELVHIAYVPKEMECVGRGTDAAVFVYWKHRRYAFKVYAAGREEKLANEIEAYRRLGETSYFPRFYGRGDNFIVISYEQGFNLYDCLLRGIYIAPWVIEEVDAAIRYARSVGLNPRDIHLKNIILQKSGVKLIDVSEYVKEDSDQRWEHLKEGYRLFYRFIARQRVPKSVIEFVKKRYESQKDTDFSVKSFGASLFRLFFYDKEKTLRFKNGEETIG